MRSLLFALAVLSISLSAAAVHAAEVYDDSASPVNDAVVRLGICTGTLISPDVVLTAGHCIPPGWRSAEGPASLCKGLPGQFLLAKRARQSEDRWTPIAPLENYVPSVKFAARPQGPGPRVPLKAYAIAHCADMALLRLAQPVPEKTAKPIPAMTRPPESPGDWLATAELGYKGFGATTKYPAGNTARQAGRVGFWTMNRCNIFTLPPERGPGGPRILRGDSGSPLLARTAKGLTVVGVLFGSGAPDTGLCGWPKPPLPTSEGTYTPTFRGPLDDSGATALGDWIEKMVAAAK